MENITENSKTKKLNLTYLVQDMLPDEEKNLSQEFGSKRGLEILL